MKQIMGQLETWLNAGDVQRLVVVVTGVDSGETLERWQFNVSLDDDASPSSTGTDENGNTMNTAVTSAPASKKGHKTEKEINVEIGERSDFGMSTGTIESFILKLSSTNSTPFLTPSKLSSFLVAAALIRQITASCTFLPLLTEPCSFDLLIYTNVSADVPIKWEESDPRYILNSQEVKLRSFTTSVHKVDSLVAYKEKDEWEI